MSHMTVKDWRERVGVILRAQTAARSDIPSHSRLSRRMEVAAVLATVLSAAATAFTGGIALMQYRTMEEALNAPNRNASFSALLSSMTEVCSSVRQIRAIYGAAKERPGLWTDNGLEQDINKASHALQPLYTRSRAEFRNFRIWVNKEDWPYLDSLRYRLIHPMTGLYRYGSLVATLDVQRKARQAFLDDSIKVCGPGVDDLIKWFTTGEKTDLENYQPRLLRLPPFEFTPSSSE